MPRTKWSVVAIGVLSFGVFLLAGCPVPFAPPTAGSLTVTIGDQVSRTVMPLLSMQPASYSICGSGPNRAIFSRATTSGSITVPALAFGTWTVTVDALNGNGDLIGQGEGSAEVHSASTSVLAVTVAPLAGNGTLILRVSWPALQVERPSIRASLIPTTGSPAALVFNVSENVGSYVSDMIPAGYQALTLQVLDNGVAVAGAVDVVRVVAGQSTMGSYDFTSVHSPGGSVVMNVTQAMADPVPITLSGVAPTITVGSSVTAWASVSDGTGSLVYVWYLDGAYLETGSSCTFGSALPAGSYRLDVTGFTADGKRAGSATAGFRVNSAPAPSLQQIEYYDLLTGTYKPIGALDIYSQQGLPATWPAVQAGNPLYYDFTSGLTPFGGYRVDLSYENYRFAASDPAATIEFRVGDQLLASGTGTVSGTQRGGTQGVMGRFPPPYLPVGYPLQNVRIVISAGGQTVTYLFPNVT